MKLFFFALLISVIGYSQPNTEVYLFDFSQNSKGFTLDNPINISDNIGYDNQPSFLNNGMGILFASTRNGQTDTALYNIENHTKTWLTDTPGSEYSPIQTPHNKYFTAINLEKDGRQLLWRYTFVKNKGHVLIDSLKIGYHAWFDKNTVVSFVLGDPATLQVSDLKSNKNSVLAQNIGRSLHKIPNSNLISYISFENNNSKIYSINPFTLEKKFIADALKESQDMAWTPDGTIIMGKADTLYKLKPDIDTTWEAFASLKTYGLTGITRISVSPLGNKIAVVVEGK